jgi:cyanophycinase
MDEHSAPATRPGRLMAIGGAEDKTRERIVLRRFVELSGGPQGTLLILATASELAETGERYSDLFRELGVGRVAVLRVGNRQDALAAGPEVLGLLRDATGLFLTGGSQLRFSAALGGTPLAAAIRRRHAEGMAVGGTSAGASLLSEHMIALGDGGSTPRRRLVHLAQGLGLAPDLIIDQHFRRRDRLGRLLTALSYNPGPLGIGVDEDTAVIIEPEGTMRVIGAGAVLVVDARQMAFTDSYAVRRGQPLAMLGLKLDVLTTGCGYDLARREGLPPLRADAEAFGAPREAPREAQEEAAALRE